MRCDKCGAEIENGALFCLSCGKPLPEDTLARKESSTKEKLEEISPENIAESDVAKARIKVRKPGLEDLTHETAMLETTKEERSEEEKEVNIISARTAEGTTENIGVIGEEGRTKPRWKRVAFVIGLILTVLALIAGGIFTYKYVKDAPRREAAGHMQSGDQMLDWCKTEADRIRELITISINGLLGGSVKTSEEFKSYSDSIQRKMGDLLRNIKSAMAYYEEILKLEDAKDYKSYARSRITQLKWSSISTRRAGKLMGRIAEILAAAEAGIRLNRNIIENEIASFMRDINESSRKARKYGEKAEEIKAKGKL